MIEQEREETAKRILEIAMEAKGWDNSGDDTRVTAILVLIRVAVNLKLDDATKELRTILKEIV